MSTFTKILSFCSLCSLTATGVYASPFVWIDEVVNVYFTGTSSARWLSNVFRDEVSEAEDLVFSFSPGMEVHLGTGLSDLDVIMVASYDIIRYDDFDDLNTEMLHFRASGAYRSSRWDVDASFSFDEQQSASGEANVESDLIETEDVTGKVTTEYRLSPKFSIASGVHYSRKEYIEPENQLANYDSLSLPVDFFYKWTPKVDLSFGYKHSIRDVDSYNNPVTGLFEAYETTTHFVNMGARGVLMPKLTGFFKVGYTLRDSESTSIRRDNSDGTLGLDADLSWATTPKLTYSIKLSRDFGVGGEGDSNEVSSIYVFSQYLLNSNWSLSPRLGYTLRSYQDGTDREDQQYSGGLSVNYSPNEYWNYSAGYSYSDNESDRAGSSYTDHTFSLSISLRY